MVRAKKSLGQNFLMHAQTATRIVAAANLPENATVLEVGPGTGMLTRELLKVAGKVIAVEADHELTSQLEETFKDEIVRGALTLVSGDIRSVEIEEIVGAQQYSVVANIPYYITGEIIRQFLTAPSKPSSMTLLVQKEVAERIARNGAKESLLSLSVTAYGSPKYCFTVPRGAFFPAPNVDSAVLSIQNIRRDAFPDRITEERFFEVLRAGFAHKRKRLAKNLESVADVEKIKAAFENLSLHTNTRSEDIPVEVWRVLAKLV